MFVLWPQLIHKTITKHTPTHQHKTPGEGQWDNNKHNSLHVAIALWEIKEKEISLSAFATKYIPLHFRASRVEKDENGTWPLLLIFPNPSHLTIYQVLIFIIIKV